MQNTTETEGDKDVRRRAENGQSQVQPNSRRMTRKKEVCVCGGGGTDVFHV